MELLKEIKDGDSIDDEVSFKLREAVRVILFDENDLIPLLFVSKHNYHKLPGGGIEKGESRMESLSRECLEEVGCEIKIEGEIGKIIEFRSKWNLKQISYCYYGEILTKGKPNFTEKELNEGFEIRWVSLNDAISKVMRNISEENKGFFTQKRDLEFLKEAKNLFN
jgi:8-oxo-dGTP diphosphatase